MAKKFNIRTGKFEEPPLPKVARDGVDGKDGIDGKDGKDGSPGVNGNNGINGKDGIDGKDGVGIQSINQPLPNKIEIKLTNDESYFLDLPKGADGKEVEFKSDGNQVDWRYRDGEWVKLFSIPKVIGGSGGGTRKVKDLRDTLITNVADGEVLAWSDTAQAWVNSAAGGGGGSSSFTEVEKDLGSSARTAGNFTIGGLSSLTVGKPVNIFQAVGPYTGKGTLADEAEMDNVSVKAAVTAVDTITAYWNADGYVKGNFKFNYLVGA